MLSVETFLIERDAELRRYALTKNDQDGEDAYHDVVVRALETHVTKPENFFMRSIKLHVLRLELRQVKEAQWHLAYVNGEPTPQQCMDHGHRQAAQARTTFRCGHPITDENTAGTNSTQRRTCRTCRRTRQRESYHRQQAKLKQEGTQCQMK